MLQRIAWRLSLALLALLLPPSARAGDASPAPGEDAVLLADGGVLRCRAGFEAGGRIELTFPSGIVRVPKEEILEIRRFEDYDPAPKNDEERKKAADGLVRWAGQWVTVARREELVRKDHEREKKLWEEIGAHCSWENRWKRNAKHFAIEADIPRKSVDFFEAQLEGYYDYFTSALKVSPQRRIPVYIFRTRDEFAAFQKKDTGEVSESVVGYFVPVQGNEHLVLFDWQGNRAETVRVLLHECTHLLIYLANPALELPTWVNEGLAEYYGACHVAAGKVKRGAIQDERLVDLRAMIYEGRLPDIETLMTRGHPDAGAPGHKPFESDDYAHAWALVHFFFHGAGGKYLPRLLAYLNGHWTMPFKEAAPGSARERFWMSWKGDRDLLLRSMKFKDYAAMEKEFQDYVAGLAFAGAAGKVQAAMMAFERDQGIEKAATAFHEAEGTCGDDPEALSLLVKGWSILPDREKEAEAALARAFEADPLNLPLRYDPSAWFPQGDAEIPHLRLCAEIGPGDPVGLAALAWLSFRGAAKPRWIDPPDSDAPDPGTAEAELASGKEIPAAECLRLATALLRTGKPAPALEAARRASRAPATAAPGFGLLARAAAAAGTAEEFAAALNGFRTARQAAPPGPIPTTPASLELETDRILVEAISYALALDKDAEARRALDGWYRKPSGGPKLEAEWILQIAVAARTRDVRAFLLRTKQALEAIPGSDRVRTCRQMAEALESGKVPQAPGGDDGGDGK